MVSRPLSFPEFEFTRRNRLIVYYLLGIVVVVLAYTGLYNLGMSALEGREQSIFRSLQTVVETMTTTGYGADAPWDTWVMNLYMVLIQLSGIGLGFFTLRVIIIPLFTGAEVDLDSRLAPKRDHLIICEYGRDSAALLEELRELDIDYVLLSSSEENAKALSDQGYDAIHGSPQDRAALQRASIDTARTVLTDTGDANVNTILTARSLRPDVTIIALTDDSSRRDVLLNAGADSVLSPYEILGHRLGEKAASSFRTELTDTIDLGHDLEVMELPVQQGSDLVGVRVRDSKIRERTGVHIIGAWIDGELELPPDPDSVIRQNTVLLVSCDHAALAELSEVTRPARSLRRYDRIIVAGLGEVGRAARSVTETAGIETVTIDIEAQSGADVVGDVSRQSVLREAGLEEAGAIIVCVPDDSTGLLTVVQARSIDEDVEILARIRDTDATRKALSAGADYVLSVPRVSARMVAKELRGEDVLAPASQIRLVRVSASPFAGSTVAESRIYEQSGCRVIAIEDETGLSGSVDPHRRLSGDERVVVVGTDSAVRTFLSQFDVSPDATR